MEAMDRIRPEVARLFAAKEERRQRLAALPYPEKVRALMQLQKMAVAILQARGQSVQPWNAVTIASSASPVKS